MAKSSQLTDLLGPFETWLPGHGGQLIFCNWLVVLGGMSAKALTGFFWTSHLLLWEMLQHSSWLHVKRFCLFACLIAGFLTESPSKARRESGLQWHLFPHPSIHLPMCPSKHPPADISSHYTIYSSKSWFTMCFMPGTELTNEWNRHNGTQTFSSWSSQSRLGDAIC